MPQQEPSHAAAKRLEIKKYPNRRYYDATRSRHVTLEEINTLIRDGYEIQVIDSKTGQDITAKVLTQIILELDAPKLGVFPVPLLHRLIRANEQLVSDFVEKYFNQALAAFLDSQKTLEQSMRHAMGLQAPMLGMPDWTKLMWGPFSPSLWPGGSPRAGNRAGESEGGGAREEAAGPGAAPHEAHHDNGNNGPGPGGSSGHENAAGDVRQQVEQLRQQLEALQQHLGDRPATGSKKRRRGGP